MAEARLAISPEQIADLASVLSPTQLRQAMYQAVKRTVAAGEKIAKAKVKAAVEVNAKAINRAIDSHVAGDQPSGEIDVLQQSLPLVAFKVSYARKRGVTVTISKGRPGIVLRHAFTADVASAAQAAQDISHKDVFNRKKMPGLQKAVDSWFDKTHGGNIRGDKQKDWMASGFGPGKKFTDRHSQVTPTGYSWRLPIGERFGPSVLDVIGRDEIEKSMLDDIGDVLEKNIDSQVSRFLGLPTLAQAVAAVDIT